MLGLSVTRCQTVAGAEPSKRQLIVGAGNVNEKLLIPQLFGRGARI
jgi:hypothetical protein